MASSRGLPDTLVRKALLASDPSFHSLTLPRAWVSAHTGRSPGLQANPLTCNDVRKDRCAKVTSRVAAKASRGPPEGSRRPGTARLVDAIGNVDAGVCHWFIRSFFSEEKQCDIVMWLAYHGPLFIEYSDI